MSKFEKGVITLSVDDGRKDAFRLVNDVLSVHKIPATFNITTAFIDKECLGNKSNITLDELKEMHKNPLVEIAGHGHTHKNFDEDIIRGRELLYEWLGIKTPAIGFASPGSGMQEDFVRENEEKLQKMGFLYIRTGHCGTVRNSETHNRLKDYAGAGINELYYEFDSMCINSVPVLCHRAVDSLKQMVDLAASEKACLTLMFHSVCKKGEYDPEDLWTYDYNKFVELIEYLVQKRNENEIEILTTREAFLKGKADF